MAVTSIPLSSITIFRQPVAPVKWTKLTTNNDCMLRVTSGVVGTGGTTAVSGLSTSTSTNIGGTYSITGASVNPSTGSIGPHSHPFSSVANATPAQSPIGSVRIYYNGLGPYKGYGGSIGFTNWGGFSQVLLGQATGSGGSHNHTASSTWLNTPFTIGGTSNWSLQYKDVILCQKTTL
jgi:hypothetical protein